MNSSFSDLGIDPTLIQALDVLNFTNPTPIQESAIPLILAGKNIVGQAQTGTGKTAAFCLPLLQATTPGLGYIQGLVLAPTRELAIQVGDAASSYARFSKHRITTIYGGQSYTIQKHNLKAGVDIVAGTPGRIMDLMNQSVLDISRVEYLVLDEADLMLDMGFAEDVEFILSHTPAIRQISLFSATFPDSVRSLVKKFVPDPERIRINPSMMTVEDTEQRYVYLRENDKLPGLSRLLEMEEIQSTLIFTRTKIRAQEISDELNLRGFQSDSLHGDLNQARREVVLKKFRSGASRILVATDVAARGLDISGLSHVINYDIPQDQEDYVHRIGRTGRAGKKGIAITFVTPKDKKKLQLIEAYTKKKIAEVFIPTYADVMAHRDNRFVDQLNEVIQQENMGSELSMVEKLLSQGCDLRNAAAAAIKLARAHESALPQEEIAREPVTSYRVIEHASEKTGYGNHRNPAVDRKKSNNKKDFKTTSPAGQKQIKPRVNFNDANMVRVKMNLGNIHGVRPGDIVGAIASEVGIPGKAIGEINIHEKHSFVDIEKVHIKQVLQVSSGKYFVKGKPVFLSLAN